MRETLAVCCIHICTVGNNQFIPLETWKPYIPVLHQHQYVVLLCKSNTSVSSAATLGAAFGTNRSCTRLNAFDAIRAKVYEMKEGKREREVGGDRAYERKNKLMKGTATYTLTFRY